MLLAVCLVACTNIDDLEDDVDALKKRVTALEPHRVNMVPQQFRYFRVASFE